MLPFASYWPMWISLFLAAIIAVACFTTVTLELYARRQKENDDASIKVTMLAGLVSFKFKLPKMMMNKRGIGFNLSKPDGHEELVELDVKHAISRYQVWTDATMIMKDFKAWFLHLLRKVELSDWHWHSRAGTGEAMSAAISCGMLWSVKGMLFGALSKYVKVMDLPHVSIEPVFQEKWFSTEWSCKLKLKLGSLLLAVIYLIFHVTAIKRGIVLWKALVSRA
ncbi:DUF2953 domain-containing protein [Paenibacillus septentrionalis]|uniref:DUF2953 domain-containing protein n=1 Tax=Paenibacillus septentrionalis TaxID=429342 RepID=A0ABW1V0P8_9BACL